jgi:hypothetical protein
MHYPKLSRSRRVRFAMIPAIFMCVIAAGCVDQQPTAPILQSVARASDVPFNKFFLAWSQNYSSSPVQTQLFSLDSRQDRQYADWWPNDAVVSFASANRGRLYIVGDEPDQWCFTPSDYATIYHDFVGTVRGVDPTARFSPAGFSEPNDHCCPPDDKVCQTNVHSISYADQFYKAYVQMYGAPPPVNEWRFHDFGLAFAKGDISGWWGRIDREASWSVSHGANMVLGAWSFTGWIEPPAAAQEHMKQAISLLMNDKRINGAVYWTREPWINSPHPLVDGDGNLTPEGQTFVNPLTDVPTDVKIVGSADGHAKLRWSNTTSAWAVEAEFWVQSRGSNSFVYHNTTLVGTPGSDQTPVVAFNIGDAVKGRVRYYNAYGQAAWTSFSNTAVLATTDTGAGQKRPLLCFLQLC